MPEYTLNPFGLVLQTKKTGVTNDTRLSNSLMLRAFKYSKERKTSSRKGSVKDCLFSGAQSAYRVAKTHRIP